MVIRLKYKLMLIMKNQQSIFSQKKYTMYKKFALLLICFQFVACTELQQVLDSAAVGAGLTSEQIGNGLKEALQIGIGKGSDRLSALDGYYKSPYKILMPEDARKVEKTLRDIGAGNLVDNAIEKINRAAEDAAKGAKPIFVSAIRQMTIQDGMSILKGDKNAATQYLNSTTRSQLYQKFQPVIGNSLNKMRALDAWTKVISKYNKIPFVQKVNPDLNDYVTNKALDGLFSMVEKEELNIRKNVSARTSDLLRKVFAKQD